MNTMKRGCVISIGVFDGVHRGHRRVLEMLRETAKRYRVPAVVVTFDPHPRRVLQPDKALPLLVSVQRRLDLLASTGCVDRVLLIPFDQSRREQTADDFVQRTLVEELGMRALVVGQNFVCGKARAGTVEYLARLGECADFSVYPVPLHTAFDDQNSEAASSTVIRRLILDGDVRRSTRLLGRYHELECNVGVSGEMLLPAEMCIPRVGQYSVLLRSRDGVTLPECVSIRSEGGIRRCFASSVDFERGAQVTVQFVDAIERVGQARLSAPITT
ncbi:FMN adenylyltransferase [Paraburkholderia pallida]|uniref:Bifunctional riboflavin kinase/FMN adenylyltransferase n=1 Tax=Paraburkholderia pallida TaxID=2547399 RepID=A0A4P7CUQ4_9BURK|nr:FMN adenylyltransferase [Paraburkholderia pallida]QBQ99848.1 FMN adenylyltransferase [Paraburkholderia pallida]